VDRSRSVLRLLADMVLNDGAVAYLNGHEFFRYNLPSGAVDYATLSSTSSTSMAIFTNLALPADLVNQGGNVVAVELHQGTINDPLKLFAMQLRLRSDSDVGGPIIIASGPDDMVVPEGQLAVFRVVAVGAQFFQWRLNGLDVPGATNASFALPASVSNDGASISVTLSNDSSSATSTNATLRVVRDFVAPTIVSGLLNPDNTIVVSFSKPLTAATATNISNYLVTNRLGQTQTIMSTTLTNGTNVVLAFGALPTAPYTVVVNGLRDTSAAQNLIAPYSAVAVGFTTLVEPMSGFWRYDDQGVDRGSAWRALNYDDSGWRGTGQALLGAKNGTFPSVLPEPLRTTMSVADAGGNRVISYYFRVAFVSFAQPYATLVFRTIVDDGCVIYLNGVEVQRIGMPSGVITYSSLSTRNVGDASDAPLIEGPFSIGITNLLDDTNVIAVEVHQVSSTSSDVYWAGEFSVTVPSVVIPAPPCPVLSWAPPALAVQRSDTNVDLSWTNPQTNGAPCNGIALFMLQQAVSFGATPGTSDWRDITNESPVTLPLTNTVQFFRLKFP